MRRAGIAFSFYVLLSIGLFGRGVVGDPAGRIVGDAGADKSLYLWSLRWWPWALAHGHNPLDVDVAWAPHGYDFGLGTAGAALALLAAPLTAVAGPVLSYNALILAAPALGATTAFLLAHRLTGRVAPAIAGGWVFGFSSYELGRIVGHLPLAFTALVPVVGLLLLDRYEGRTRRGTFVLLLSLVLTLQFWVVPQVYFSLTIVATVAAGIAVALLGWARMLPTLRDAALAWGVSVALVSPVVAYAALSDAAAPARSPFSESADLLNYAVPTRRTWLRPPGSGEVAERFTGTGTEQGAYLSLPLLALVLVVPLCRPRSRERLLLAALFAAALVLSLGTRVKVAGVVVGIGPWSLAAPLPVVGSALPARFTLYTSLFAALLVAVALRDRPTPLRWSLALAGIVLTLPNLQLRQWESPVPGSDVLASAVVRGGSTVLVLPYGPGGWSLLWQAEAGFRIRLVGGHFGLRVTPKERPWRDVYENLGSGRIEPGRLRQFLSAHGVDAVVIGPGTRRGARRLVAAALPAPVSVVGGLVYRVRSCGGGGGARAAGRGRACASARSGPSRTPSRRTGSGGTRLLPRTATDRG